MITAWIRAILLSSEKLVLKCIKLPFQDSSCNYFSLFGLCCEQFFRKKQEIITLQQNRRAAMYHKGSIGFPYVHKNGEFLFLGWHCCPCWCRGEEVTLTLHIYTLNKISWKLDIPFMHCIIHNHPISIFLCSVWPCHHKASVLQEDWPGSGEYLDTYENLFGSKEWRRGSGQEDALVESKGEGLISSCWNNYFCLFNHIFKFYFGSSKVA